jgi:hypothetical protein
LDPSYLQRNAAATYWRMVLRKPENLSSDGWRLRIGQRISRSVHGEAVSGSARTDFAKPTVIIQRLHRKAMNILNIASVVYQNTISLATPNPRSSLRYWL